MSGTAQRRPKHLDLLRIHFPVPAVVSILHRVSGAGMIVMLPVALWLLDLSLGDRSDFDLVAGALGHPLSRLVALGLFWAFVHHLLAGIRFLLIDIGWGAELAQARASAWAVAGLAAALTVLAAAGLFL